MLITFRTKKRFENKILRFQVDGIHNFFMFCLYDNSVILLKGYIKDIESNFFYGRISIPNRYKQLVKLRDSLR
jgi:hypothetical protein